MQKLDLLAKNEGFKILHLYKEGTPLKIIAKKYHISISSASKVIQKIAKVKKLKEIRKQIKTKKILTDKNLCNKCKERPKGVNRYYCDVCLKKITGSWWDGSAVAEG